jgi:lipid A disaccharide synthetase
LLLLLDEKRNEAARQRLREVAQQLGEGGASARAANVVLEALQDWKQQ